MKYFSGIQYVYIAIANAFGLDKLVWEDRISWAQSKTIEELIELVPEASEPPLMLKAINALQDALEGIPTGYVMSLDATCSGLQIMGILAGCDKTATSVNVIGTGKRECVYQKTADTMGVTRDIIKKPLMTVFYGSTAKPKEIFGEGTDELKAFYNALETELPGAMECMMDIQGCWNPEALEYKWTLPDDHTVVMKVMTSVSKKIEVDELDHATFTYIAEVNAPVKKGLSLAANVTHSVDSYICREMIRKADTQGFELLTIHDAFFASPNHMNKVRQNYLDILIRISKMDLLQSILREITGVAELVHTKCSNDLHLKMVDAEYALS